MGKTEILVKCKFPFRSLLVLAYNRDLAGRNFPVIFTFCRKFTILAVPRKLLQFSCKSLQFFAAALNYLQIRLKMGYFYHYFSSVDKQLCNTSVFPALNSPTSHRTKHSLHAKTLLYRQLLYTVQYFLRKMIKYVFFVNCYNILVFAHILRNFPAVLPHFCRNFLRTIATFFIFCRDFLQGLV